MDRSSRAERLAYVALSGAWTAGAVLLLLVGRPGRLLERLTLEREVRPAGERVTYLVTGSEPQPGDAPAVSTPTTRTRTTSRPQLTSPRADSGAVPPTPRAPAVVPTTLPPIPLTLDSAGPVRGEPTTREMRAAGAPASAAVSGFSRPVESLAPDSTKGVVLSAISAGRYGVAALKRQQREELYHTQAGEVIASRAAGTPNPLPVSGGGGGGGGSVPLPFGGPSRKQRERDRRLHARNLEALTRLQRKADSLAALRKRAADSLRVPSDSSRSQP